MDNSCTIIRIDKPTKDEYECEFHCDAPTAIKAASLIMIQVLKYIPKENHELVFITLKDYVYAFMEEVTYE